MHVRGKARSQVAESSGRIDNIGRGARVGYAGSEAQGSPQVRDTFNVAIHGSNDAPAKPSVSSTISDGRRDGLLTWVVATDPDELPRWDSDDDSGWALSGARGVCRRKLRAAAASAARTTVVA